MKAPLALLAFSVALLAPPAAHAGTVAASGSTVTYRAAAGEANRITVTGSRGSVTVRDAGAPVTGCAAVTANEARCDGPFRRVSLTLGDGADRATGAGSRPR